MKPVIVIFQHAESEGPGKVRSFLEASGYHLETVFWPDQRAAPVLPKPVAGCVILGGAMNVQQHRVHPWLVEEKRQLEKILNAGIPLLGICLGAQMIADVLGARIFQNPQEEIGWWPVDFTSEAAEKFPALPASATVLHWHGDTFSLPKDSIRIATSAGCKEQGFLYRQNVLGLQFHPEVDPKLAKSFCCGDDSYVWPKGEWIQEKPKLISDAAGFQDETDRVLRIFVDHLFPPLTPNQ